MRSVPGPLLTPKSVGKLRLQAACAWIPLLLALAVQPLGAFAAERIPPAPKQYFTDYASVVPAATAQSLNGRLEDFERQTSSQILVVIYSRMESDSSVEDYTVRVAQAWKVGQKGRDNGAVLFVFMQQRQLYLQVGYGLEGAIPDVLSKRIIEDEIKPHFRSGNYASGLEAGVSAILAAARGEYTGTGRTVAEQQRRQRGGNPASLIVVLVIAVILLSVFGRATRGRSYSRRGSRWGGWGGGGFGGGSWGGGGGWSGGGGFSGGGGGFGGGGAGGRW